MIARYRALIQTGIRVQVTGPLTFGERNDLIISLVLMGAEEHSPNHFKCVNEEGVLYNARFF